MTRRHRLRQLCAFLRAGCNVSEIATFYGVRRKHARSLVGALRRRIPPIYRRAPVSDLTCGRVGRQPLSEIADRAAQHLTEHAGTWCVCLAPTGHVTVETERSAVAEDVVGYYNKAPGRMELWKLVHEELKHAVAERRMSAEVKYRGRVLGKRRAA